MREKKKKKTHRQWRGVIPLSSWLQSRIIQEILRKMFSEDSIQRCSTVAGLRRADWMSKFRLVCVRVCYTMSGPRQGCLGLWTLLSAPCSSRFMLLVELWWGRGSKTGLYPPRYNRSEWEKRTRRWFESVFPGNSQTNCNFSVKLYLQNSINPRYRAKVLDCPTFLYVLLEKWEMGAAIHWNVQIYVESKNRVCAVLMSLEINISYDHLYYSTQN